MRSKVNSLAGMWVCPLLLWAGLATAASPDLRLVDAVARQDADTARAPLQLTASRGPAICRWSRRFWLAARTSTPPPSDSRRRH